MATIAQVRAAVRRAMGGKNAHPELLAKADGITDTADYIDENGDVQIPEVNSFAGRAALVLGLPPPPGISTLGNRTAARQEARRRFGTVRPTLGKRPTSRRPDGEASAANPGHAEALRRFGPPPDDAA